MTAPAPLKALLGARCVDDPERRQRYEIPERGPAGHASCVLLPESDAEVAAILETCNRHRLALVVSAGRTGLVEAQRPAGEAVLSLERLRRVLAVNAGARLVTVEAGLPIDALNEQVAPHGLFWPLEMGSSSAATVGACVANASAGANAVCYGTAAHLCESAWGVWGDGSAAGPFTAECWTAPPPDRLAIDSARIRPDWGLIGTQGAAGVVTRVTLRLQPLPVQREGVLLPVATMPEAMDVLAAARVEFPGDVEEFEFISREALALVRALKGAAFRSPLGELDSPSFVLLQLKSPAAGTDLAERLYEFLSAELALPEERIGYAPLADLKAIRHSITEASNHRMRALGGGRLAFDTATPVARFGEYLATLEAEVRRTLPAVAFVAFGHAGVGGAHLHLLGTREQPVGARADELTTLVFEVTARFGGTFSAEHGVGVKWGEAFWLHAPPASQQALLDLKRAHDPLNVLNPRSFGFSRRL